MTTSNLANGESKDDQIECIKDKSQVIDETCEKLSNAKRPTIKRINTLEKKMKHEPQSETAHLQQFQGET